MKVWQAGKSCVQPRSDLGVLSGRVSSHSWTNAAGQLIGCAFRLMLTQTCREAFCYKRNAVLHNTRFDWAGFEVK